MPVTTRVRDVMSTPVVTLRAAEKVEHAADVLAEKNVSSLPVVDGNGRLLGILRDDEELVVDKLVVGIVARADAVRFIARTT